MMPFVDDTKANLFAMRVPDALAAFSFILRARVTRRAREKWPRMWPNPIFCQYQYITYLFRDESGPKSGLLLYVHNKKLPKEKNLPISENSPNMVTLLRAQKNRTKRAKKVRQRKRRKKSFFLRQKGKKKVSVFCVSARRGH
jgi:hypothetical protein